LFSLIITFWWKKQLQSIFAHIFKYSGVFVMTCYYFLFSSTFIQNVFLVVGISSDYIAPLLSSMRVSSFLVELSYDVSSFFCLVIF